MMDFIEKRNHMMNRISRERYPLRFVGGDVPTLLAFIEQNVVRLSCLIWFHSLNYRLDTATRLAGRLCLDPTWRSSIASGRPMEPAAILLCLFCLFALPACFGTAEALSPVETEDANLPESLYLEARDGFPLHVSRYRPADPQTGALILIHDWTMAGLSCWGTLPDSLAAAGFEVLVPDLRAHGLSRTPMTAPVGALIPTTEEMAVLESDASHWFDLISGATDRIGLLCVGSMGTLVPWLAGYDARISELIWISPETAGAAPWWTMQRSDLDYLFIASETEIESSALAGDLFSRFNTSAQLRLYSRGAAACGLLDQISVRDGLVAWLRESK